MAAEPAVVTDIAERVEAVKRRITEAASRVARDPAEITIVGVTKTFGVDTIAEALDAGVRVLGENRVQEARDKVPLIQAMGYTPEWHLIGNLQSNKVRAALEMFAHIQSVDSVKLAGAIDRHAQEMCPRVPILIEINTSGEASKHGFASNGSALDAIEAILELPRLEVRGLMTAGPMTADEGTIRSAFRSLRILAADLAARYPSVSWDTLSMGMSDDFEIAVEEGSTMVRLGRVLFGDRGPRATA